MLSGSESVKAVRRTLMKLTLGFFDVLQPSVNKKGSKIATGMSRKEISVQSLRKPGL